MDRRSFLRAASISAATMASASRVWAFQPGPRPLGGGANKLIIANMLGGWDTLNIVVPHATTEYNRRRPTIAIPAPDPLDPTASLPLETGIGLHPALAPIHGLYAAGDMTVVQKVGYPFPSLSHFTSQDIMSKGLRDFANPDTRGWLGRLADHYLGTPMQIVGIDTGNRIDFRATQNTPVAIDRLEDFDIPGNPFDPVDSELRNAVTRQVLDASGGVQGLAGSARDSLRTVFDLVDEVGAAVANYQSTVLYPDTGFARSLQDVARLMQSPIPSQVFYVQRGGFDDHSSIVNSLNGSLTDVGAALGAFVQDLQAMGEWQNTTIVLISEFGRRVFENGSAGTDHGEALHFLLLGGGLTGGLRGTNVQDQDLLGDNLAMEIDFREVYSEIIQNRFQLDPTPLFPGWTRPNPTLSLF